MDNLLAGLCDNLLWIHLAVLACVTVITCVVVRLMTEVFFSMDEEIRDLDSYHAENNLS